MSGPLDQSAQGFSADQVKTLAEGMIAASIEASRVAALKAPADFIASMSDDPEAVRAFKTELAKLAKE